jgi:predicted Zn-dependent protease
MKFLLFLICSSFLVLIFFGIVINEDVKAGKKHEKAHSIEICCTWGQALADGELTYRISGGNSEFRDAVRSAASEWESNIKNLIFKEDKENNGWADINIKFEKDGDDISDEKLKRGLVTAGITKYKLNWQGAIENVRMELAKGTDEQGFSPDDIKMIAEHEFGHALGIGHANFKSSLMAPTIGNDQIREISECEIKGVLLANAWKLKSDNNSPSSFTGSERIKC